ncbi:ParA family protein [Nostoc sp. 'Peltigera membranacea cyanobiont' N6]|uniref:ParA family protein n=1 Tax=Nostoc sp. 'Peltigera membranacea cyanobiont' N6 TaxID=1261031 RepID=UPI00267E2AE7
MSRIIAVFNQAGGVAKTTLTQNLGYQIAQLGHGVLLISPQKEKFLTNFGNY